MTELLSLISTHGDTMDLALLAAEQGQRLGRLRLQSDGFVFYKTNGSEGEFRRENIERVQFVDLGDQRLGFVVRKKSGEAWLERMKKKHPIRAWLGLIKPGQAVDVDCGVFEKKADAKAAEQFLRRLGYVVVWSFREL